MKKKEIKAIYNEDLEDFLQKHGEVEKILNGNRFCKMCGAPISLHNIQMIIPSKEGKFEYICDSVSCVEDYHE